MPITTDTCSFFDHVKYAASEFLARVADFIGNGVKTPASDFALSAQSTPDMTLNVAAGTAWVDGYRIGYLGDQSLSFAAADATNPRIDLVEVGYTGSGVQGAGQIKVVTGTPASSPIQPQPDAGFIALFAVAVAANATALTTGDVTNLRQPVSVNIGKLIADAGSFTSDGKGNVTLAGALAVGALTALNGGLSGIASGMPFKMPTHPNLLPNSSFRLGKAYWTGIGSNGFYVSTDINGGSLGNGTNVSSSAVSVTTINIPAGEASLTLSASMSAAAITTGGMGLEVIGWDSSNTQVAAESITPTNGTATQRYSVTINLPAETSYVTVVAYLLANTTFTSGEETSWEFIKLEYGNVATPYSAEADLWPALTGEYDWDYPVAHKAGIKGALGTLGADGRGNPIGANLLPEGSFRFGGTLWSVDSNFTVSFGYSGGPILVLNASVSAYSGSCNSRMKIPCSTGVGVTISGEIDTSGLTTGSAQLVVNAYNSSDSLISSFIVHNVGYGAVRQRYSGTGTTPTGTAYVMVTLVYSNITGSAGALTFANIKFELGSVATPMSNEADFWTGLTHGAAGIPVIALAQTSGIKVQWGTVSTGNVSPLSYFTTTVTFPIAFISTPQVFLTTSDYVTGNHSSIAAASKTASGFTLDVLNTSSSDTEGYVIEWIAIGN